MRAELSAFRDRISFRHHPRRYEYDFQRHTRAMPTAEDHRASQRRGAADACKENRKLRRGNADWPRRDGRRYGIAWKALLRHGQCRIRLHARIHVAARALIT